MIQLKASGQWTNDAGGAPGPVIALRWYVDQWGAWIPALLTVYQLTTGA